MSFTGASLDGWQLPAFSSPPGVAELLLGEPFGGLDEGLALAAGSSYDANLSSGFLDGAPWLETGAHAHAEEQVAAVGQDHLDVAPVHVLAGPGVDTTSAALRPGVDEWRCLGGCAQPCSRCESGAEQEWCKYNHSDSRTLPLHLRPGACLLRRRRRWATTSWWASEELRTERCV
jgi:hypothetical protein